jgi:hypothetical protein
MAITCPGCHTIWVPGSDKAAVSLFCPSCRHTPALGRLAARLSAPKPASDDGKRVLSQSARPLPLKDIAVIAGAVLFAATLTFGTFSAAGAFRSRLITADGIVEGRHPATNSGAPEAIPRTERPVVAISTSRKLLATGLIGRQVANGGLKELKEHKSLRAPELLGTKVTDVGDLQAALPELKIRR